jgi:hypothetical protein
VREPARDVEAALELERRGPHPDRVHFLVVLVLEPGLDDVPGEDVALQEELVVLAEALERLVEREEEAARDPRRRDPEDRELEVIGSPEAVEKLLVEAVKSGLHERFARVRAHRPPADDVAVGRAWVEAYVPYVHYVEGVFQAAQGKLDAHAEPAAEGSVHPAPTHDHGARHEEAPAAGP